MNGIMLSSGVLRITKIKKKTRAELFKDLKVGDRIEITVPVEYVGGSRGRSYSVDLKIKNIGNGVEIERTFNQVSKTLKNFEFEIQHK